MVFLMLMVTGFATITFGTAKVGAAQVDEGQVGGRQVGEGKVGEEQVGEGKIDDGVGRSGAGNDGSGVPLGHFFASIDANITTTHKLVESLAWLDNTTHYRVLPVRCQVFTSLTAAAAPVFSGTVSGQLHCQLACFIVNVPSMRGRGSSSHRFPLFPFSRSASPPPLQGFFPEGMSYHFDGLSAVLNLRFDDGKITTRIKPFQSGAFLHYDRCMWVQYADALLQRNAHAWGMFCDTFLFCVYITFTDLLVRPLAHLRTYPPDYPRA